MITWCCWWQMCCCCAHQSLLEGSGWRRRCSTVLVGVWVFFLLERWCQRRGLVSMVSMVHANRSCIVRKLALLGKRFHRDQQRPEGVGATQQETRHHVVIFGCRVQRLASEWTKDVWSSHRQRYLRCCCHGENVAVRC